MMRKLSFPIASSSNTSISSSSIPSTPTTTTAPSTTTTTTTTTTPANLPSSLSDPSLPFPKLIVFDLDYTLWPFWVDTHATPPFKFNAQHTSATDRTGEEFAFYADDQTRRRIAHLGALPRPRPAQGPTPPPSSFSSSSFSSSIKRQHTTPSIDVFDGGLEIYPGGKIKHFEQLQKRNGGLRFEDVLFFDDEARDRETETLGLTMRLVRDGVSWEEVAKGVEEWRRRRKIQV
ncbi:Magnesium-dependent phosphatase 1 [Cladobotryum mycophilum]|uniref:Magnesium-dependent phosphatase 1 n=1 Tax=Cladobotryum mycophilum TaxID=491253 RepID=A0ABR0SH51_9HYPO